jgi:hypothetical protein
MGQNNKPLRAGELARLAAVSSDTLRHYERIGILPKAPRTLLLPSLICRSFPPPRARSMLAHCDPTTESATIPQLRTLR